MSSDSPIAVYRERLAQVSRALALFSDRIEIQARWLLGKSYRMTVRLDDLQVQPTRAKVRQRMFKRSLGIGTLSVAAAVVFSRPGYDWFPIYVIWAFYALAVVAGGFVLMSWPKVTFVRFMNRRGRPALDIFESGPDAPGFEDFVKEVQKRIRRQ